MPLRTAIVRDGQPLPLRFGGWHLQCMLDVVEIETGTKNPLGALPYTATAEHTFTDPADGEVLTIKPGDRLDAWRDR
jgi:hypothetical protein